MCLCWAASCRHNDSSSTRWKTANLENFLPRPHALHSEQEKKWGWGGGRTSEKGVWNIRKWLMGWRKETGTTGTTGTKKTRPPDIVFGTPWCSQGTLLSWQSCQCCAFNPCKDAMSFPWLHQWSTENLPSTASDRDGASTKKSLHKVEKIYNSEKWVVNFSSQP